MLPRTPSPYRSATMWVPPAAIGHVDCYSPAAPLHVVHAASLPALWIEYRRMRIDGKHRLPCAPVVG